jgi:AcrR family transcriptional regulator
MLQNLPPDHGPARSWARKRILDAAYQLFSRRGVGSVGVDTIVAEAGTAKMSLYRHFRSKEELVLAFMQERERVWTLEWLEAEVLRRARTPEARLLAIFDVFDGWFQKPDFEGCAFINILLEARQQPAIRDAAAAHLAAIRAILARFAEDAALADPDKFARTWHFLMKGCIVTAGEGHLEAAREAKAAARVILHSWPRRRPLSLA